MAWLHARCAHASTLLLGPSSAIPLPACLLTKLNSTHAKGQVLPAHRAQSLTGPHKGRAGPPTRQAPAPFFAARAREKGPGRSLSGTGDNSSGIEQLEAPQWLLAVGMVPALWMPSCLRALLSASAL